MGRPGATTAERPDASDMVALRFARYGYILESGRVVMDISDRVVVLDYGRKIGDGTPDNVRSNEQVIAAYLGVAH